MENVWHYLQSHYWSNRAYEDYDQLLDAAQQAWREACLIPQLMQTVGNAPYAKSAEFN